MSRSLGVLTLDLIAKTGGFEQGMDRAKRKTAESASDMKRQLSEIKAEAIDLGRKSAMAAAAVAAAAAAMGVAFYRSGAKSVDALAQMSDQIGIATEDLGALRYAAQQMSGMAEGTFDMSMRRMTRRIAEAADGAGPAVGALKSLRLEAGELARMSPDAQFRAIADAMGKIPSQGERLRATMAIFDTEGMPLINTLSKGADAIREMEVRARAMGMTISRIDAAQVEAANAALAESAATVEAFKMQLAVQFAPVVKAATDLLGGMSDEIGSMSDVAETTFNNVIRGLALVANAADGAKRTFEIAANWIIAVWATVAEKIATAFSFVLKVYDLVPGIDLSDQIASVEQFAQQSSDIAGMAVEEIDAILSRPLAGNAFEEFVANAREAGRAAAEAAAGAGVIKIPAMPDTSPDTSPNAIDTSAAGDSDAITKRIEALKLEAQTMGMSAMQAELYKAALDGVTASQYQALEAALASVQTKREEIEAQEALATAESRYATEEEQLILHHENLLNQYESFRERDASNQERWDQVILDEKADFTEKMNKLDEQRRKQQLSAATNMLGQLSGLMSSRYRALFEIGKVAALANIAVMAPEKAEAAAAWGMKLGGPPVAAAFTAASWLVSAAHAAEVASASFGGGGAKGGGGISGGVSTIPAAPAPIQLDGGAGSGGNQSPSVTVNVAGSVIGMDGASELAQIVGDYLSDQINNGDRLFIDVNSRNGRMLSGR